MHSSMDSSALLNHIVAQTRANIDFLVAQHQISQPDAQLIISKLPAPMLDAHVESLVHDTQNLMARAPPVPPVPSYTIAAPSLPKARAIWGYNEGRSDPNDLYFTAGDIIEIVAETNADWWTGRHNGSEGLFPANYVERLPAESAPSPAPPSMPQREPSTYTSHYTPPSNYGPPPSGPPVSYQPAYQPPAQYQPPPQSYQQQYQAPAPAPTPQEEPKKSKFGGMGSTLKHAAVGGVGFGAGSAVGSGIINSIF